MREGRFNDGGRNGRHPDEPSVMGSFKTEPTVQAEKVKTTKGKVCVSGMHSPKDRPPVRWLSMSIIRTDTPLFALSCGVFTYLLVHGLAGLALSNHVSEDSEHGGTAVVKLNIQLADLLFWVLNVGSEVSNSVVSVVLGGRHPGELNKGEEKKDLDDSLGGDGEDSLESGGDVGELEVVGGGQVSVEHNVVVVDDVSDNGSHGNAAMLPLDGTTALEGLRLGLEPAKGIKDSEGLGDSKLELVDGKRRGGTALLGRSKGGGGSGEEGGDSKLHLDLYVWCWKRTCGSFCAYAGALRKRRHDVRAWLRSFERIR